MENRPDPVEEYLSKLERTLNKISREQIWVVIQVLFNAWKEGRHIFLFGNGGSAATASHMANDLNKLTVADGKPRVKAIALSDNIPLITAWANDESYDSIFSEQLVNFVNHGDIALGISTSGNSENVLRALEAARLHGAITIGFTGSIGGRLKEYVDYCIYIPDDHIGRQEDGHLILDHVISNTLKEMIAEFQY